MVGFTATRQQVDNQPNEFGDKKQGKTRQATVMKPPHRNADGWRQKVKGYQQHRQGGQGNGRDVGKGMGDGVADDLPQMAQRHDGQPNKTTDRQQSQNTHMPPHIGGQRKNGTGGGKPEA